MRASPVTLAEFPFAYRENLLWIEVNVPQCEKPLNFLVDTGAGASAINLRTAERLGLKLGQKVEVRGVDAALTGYWQESLSARIGEVRLPTRYLALDLEKLSHSCERPVDGLLGADFLCGHVVQIDFVGQKIRLLKHEKPSRSDAAVPLQLRPCGMRVAITVNGKQRQWVRLDTGCATPLQWATSEVKLGSCDRKAAIGLAEISIPQTTTTVGVGDYEFQKVPTGLHPTAIFPGESGLLGNGLLSRFSTITIDAKAGRLVLGTVLPTQ